MSRRRTLGALAALCATAMVTACASIPTSGPVVEGSADVEASAEIGFNVQGPPADADPEQIVQGFVSVAQLGPASASTFTTAREYTTPVAWAAWDRYARVLVLAEYPQWTVDDHDDSSATTRVHGEAMVVATLDEDGVYTELPEPSAVDVSFDLSRGTNGQWRISGLDDGLLVLSNFLGDAFHRTSLYYPTADRRWWVPDVRWFPGQSWRTAATQAILAGPPPWLDQTAISVVPEGTTLAIDAVTVASDGTIDVSLTSAISTAPPEDRALMVAQLEATLREGEGRSVVISDGTSPLAVTPASDPTRPVTVGEAVALVQDDDVPVLRRVVGRELMDLTEPAPIDGFDVTAVGVAPDGAAIVVRDGTERLVRVTGEAAPVVLYEGEELVAPSLDRFGAIWTADDGAVRVLLPSGDAVGVGAEWLDGLEVRSLRVSPEGARVAVVTEGPAGPEVWAAAIERDAADMPTGLSSAVHVGASVDSVIAADWYEESTLVLLGRDVDGVRALFVAGIGGLGGTVGGESRVLAIPDPPATVTAGVGTSPVLLVDSDGTLHVRQSAALWPIVAEGVLAVAYPG